ncbi:addiction module HigA family antidote [Luteibacter sp. 621]|uniref:HigA family addiction module antitoxin n=1 Tax=Luteibacter sp. 621 TaxID=3373916 RepID=UPI003D1ABA6F
MTRDFPYPHPGEILQEEFLTPMAITKYRLAKAIGVPAPRIGEIIAGRRAITADTALRLAKFFGQSDEFWSNMQAGYDREMLRPQIERELIAIVPWAAIEQPQPPSRPAPRRRPKT